MESIKDTVAAVLKDLEGRTEQARVHNPQEHLERVFAKKDLKHVRVAYFRKGIIGITVDTSAWLYHLTLRKEELLTKLRAVNDQIKEIRFNVGDVSPGGPGAKIKKVAKSG